MYISGKVRYKLQGVSYIVSKRHELWSTNGFKLEVSFHPPSVNSAFRFIAMLRRRRPVSGTQPNFAKRRSVIRANNLPYREVAVVPPVKSGTKKLWHLFVFWQLRDLMANFCLMKRDIDNRARPLESTKGLQRCLKFHELWSTNGLKPVRSLYPPSLLCFVPVHRTPLYGINEAPHSNSK